MNLARIVTLVIMVFTANSLFAQRELMADTARVAKDSTLVEYLDAYKVRPEEGRLNLIIARLYTKQDSFETALPYALQAQKQMPENDETHYVLARVHYNMRNFAAAVDAMNKAIAIDPDGGYYSYLNMCRIMVNTDTTLVTKKRDFIEIHSYNIAEMVKWAKDPNHKYYYKALMAKFTKDWASLSLDEFYMLYFGQSVDPSYDPYAIRDGVTAELKRLYSEEKYEEGIIEGNKLLPKYPLDIDVNWYLGMCHYKLEQYDLYERYVGVYRCIMLGIVSTGDGDTPKTAYVVITVDDEYEILDYLSYAMDKQELLDKDGHSFDKIIGYDRDTEEDLVVYFNIDRPFGALTGMLDGISVPEGKKGKKKK